MTEFKVGDRVKVKTTHYGAEELQPGATGVVTEVFDPFEGEFLTAEVRMDSGYESPPGDPTWPFDVEWLELAD